MPLTHGTAGMAKRLAITAMKAKRLPAKKSKLLVAEIHNEEQDISSKALDTSTNIQFETSFKSYS